MASLTLNYTDASGTPHPECYAEIVSIRILSDISTVQDGDIMIKIAVYHSLAAKEEGLLALFGKNILVPFQYSLIKAAIIENKSLYTIMAEYLESNTTLITTDFQEN